jgi:hypothetical protein
LEESPKGFYTTVECYAATPIYDFHLLSYAHLAAVQHANPDIKKLLSMRLISIQLQAFIMEELQDHMWAIKKNDSAQELTETCH